MRIVDRGSGAPLVCAELDAGTRRQLQDRVETGQADPPDRRPVPGHDEEGVIATGTQAADGTHGIATATVRHQPLPARALVQRAAGL